MALVYVATGEPPFAAFLLANPWFFQVNRAPSKEEAKILQGNPTMIVL